jgi:hypothetical protein
VQQHVGERNETIGPAQPKHHHRWHGSCGWGQNYRSVESLFLGATLEHFLITNCENKTMKKYMMTLLLCLFVTGTAVTFTGCDQGQGPVERAGESIDEAAEEIVDEIDDATDAK